MKTSMGQGEGAAGISWCAIGLEEELPPEINEGLMILGEIRSSEKKNHDSF